MDLSKFVWLLWIVERFFSELIVFFKNIKFVILNEIYCVIVL